MLKVHEYNGLLKEYKEEELVSVVADLYHNLNGAIKIMDCLAKFKNNELDEFEVLDELEMLVLGDAKGVCQYARNASSSVNAINRVLRITYGFKCDGVTEPGYRATLDADIYKVVSVFNGLSTEEADIINGLAYAVASNAAYVLRHEFCLDEFIESYHNAGNNLEEAVIDVAFQQFCNEAGLGAVETASSVLECSSIYKPALPVFDEHPELEEEFEKIVGANLADVDPESLTIDVVLKVLNGTIQPCELFDMFNNANEEN
ncbi:hypothetical protein D7Y41_02775 [Anaerotruncus sp. 1XD22-93]|nr:hypothetical protein [Lachnospiraceae bacterium]NBI74213.1 hypothetical protein [Lachnospiraceae bacterium]RKK00398.1 hypothetical protein D7Y41_02775 [Anaerotruncus sp. 1XD22-93]